MKSILIILALFILFSCTERRRPNEYLQTKRYKVVVTYEDMRRDTLHQVVELDNKNSYIMFYEGGDLLLTQRDESGYRYQTRLARQVRSYYTFEYNGY